MAGAKFDIQFAGELIDGADPEQVRERLQQMFRLSDEAAARLFAGRPVTIKRGVDVATASRFREVFREVGALVRVVPEAGGAPGTTGAEDRESTTQPPTTDEPSSTPGHFRLAPADDDAPLERETPAPPRTIDISHLSLVTGDDWTLEDCEPPLPPIALPDISYLGLVLPEQDESDERGDAS